MQTRTSELNLKSYISLKYFYITIYQYITEFKIQLLYGLHYLNYIIKQMLKG